MGGATKINSMVVERPITYLSDLDVTYVSLVKHGANRAPFKVLKSEEGGGLMPDKSVVFSVLVPKSASDAVKAEALKGYDLTNSVDHESYTEYVQIDKSAVDYDNRVAAKLEGDSGVYLVLVDKCAEGTTATEETPENTETPETTETTEGDATTQKAEATVKKMDYATYYDFYDELVAMADIALGIMRQEYASAEAVRTVLGVALDNFKTAADVIINNLTDTAAKEEVAKKMAYVAEHPLPSVKEEVEDVEPEGDKEPEVTPAPEPEKTTEPEPEQKNEEVVQLEAKVTELNNQLVDLTSKLEGMVAAIEKASAKKGGKLVSVAEVIVKAAGDRTSTTKSDEGKGTFAGAIFNKQ